MTDSGKSRRGYHRLTTFATCERLSFYQEVLGLEPLVEAEPLALGSLFHAAAAAHYSREADPVAAMRAMPTRVAYMFDRARRVWERYLAWAREADDFTVVAVEQEFAVKLLGEEVTARLDLVYQRDGALWICEHKTTSSDVLRHPGDWVMRGQTVLQDTIGRLALPGALGLPYGGLVVNAVSSDPNGEPVAHRERIDDRMSQEWRQTALRGLASMAAREGPAYRERGADPAEWPAIGLESACMNKWGPCRWRQLCRDGVASAELHGFVAQRDEGQKWREAAGL